MNKVMAVTFVLQACINLLKAVRINLEIKVNFILEIVVMYLHYVVQSPVCVVTGSESLYLRELYK